MKINIFKKEINLWTFFYIGLMYSIIACSLCWNTINFGAVQNMCEGFTQGEVTSCKKCANEKKHSHHDNKFIQNQYIYDTPTHPLNEKIMSQQTNVLL